MLGRKLQRALSDERIAQTELTSPRVEELADALLLEAGLRDYFDRVIYATATALNVALLTEDRELVSIAAKFRFKPPRVLSWKEVVNEVI